MNKCIFIYGGTKKRTNNKKQRRTKPFRCHCCCNIFALYMQRCTLAYLPAAFDCCDLIIRNYNRCRACLGNKNRIVIIIFSSFLFRRNQIEMTAQEYKWERKKKRRRRDRVGTTIVQGPRVSERDRATVFMSA